MKPDHSDRSGSSTRRDARSTLTQARSETHPVKRKLLLLGYITRLVEERGERVFLVGGEAVEVYTAGQFSTGDVDITTTDRKTTETALARLGFKQVGMVWLNEPLGIAVHIVGSLPSQGVEKARSFRAGPYRVHVLGVESLIVDRLSAAKFWKSERDLEQAQVLYTNFEKTLDRPLLEDKASRSSVHEYLAKLKKPKTLRRSTK